MAILESHDRKMAKSTHNAASVAEELLQKNLNPTRFQIITEEPLHLFDSNLLCLLPETYR